MFREMLRHAVRKVGPLKKKPQAPPGQLKKVRLSLELLETRETPAAITWTGAAGNGIWAAPANWTGTAVPTANDDVTFDQTSSANCVVSSNTAALCKSLKFNGYGGTLSVVGSITPAEAIEVNGGTANVAVDGDATLRIQAGVSCATGTGFRLTNHGSVIWGNGDINLGAGWLVNGPSDALPAGSAVFDIQCDERLYGVAGQASFSNFAVVLKTRAIAGASSTIDVPFSSSNEGGGEPLVRIDVGELAFLRDSYFFHTELTAMDPGGGVSGVIRFRTGASTYTLDDGTVLNGTGNFTMSGRMVIPGEATVRSTSNVFMDNGASELTGAGQFVNDNGGVFTVWNGALNDLASFLNRGIMELAIRDPAEGGPGFTINSSVLENCQIISWTSGRFDMVSNNANREAAIANLGWFTVSTDSLLGYNPRTTGPASFMNKGLFQKTGGMGVTEIQVPFLSDGNDPNLLLQGLAVDFSGGFTQNGGYVGLGGGTLQASSYDLERGELDLGRSGGATLAANLSIPAGSMLCGQGTINGSVEQDGGAIFPGFEDRFGGGTAGYVIQINGDYEQSGGVVELRLANGNSDSLQVSGTASISGTLRLRRDSTRYTPAQNDSYNVLVSGELNGQFALDTSPIALSDGLTWSQGIGGLGISVTVVQGQQGAFNPPPAGITITSNATAEVGTAAGFTVSALDEDGNVDTAYNGTLALTCSDSNAYFPSTVTLTNGTASFCVTFATGGYQGLTAADTDDDTLLAMSDPIAVSETTADHFVVVAPSYVSYDEPFTFTVTAVDVHNFTVASYTGTVRFSVDPAYSYGVSLPADATLTNGIGTFTATVFLPETTQRIYVTDAQWAEIFGVSNDVLISGV